MSGPLRDFQTKDQAIGPCRPIPAIGCPARMYWRVSLSRSAPNVARSTNRDLGLPMPLHMPTRTSSFLITQMSPPKTKDIL